MLSFLGSVVIMGVSVAVGLCYRRYREEMVEYMQALYDFLSRLCKEVECYGRSIHMWISEYDSPILVECGFLEQVKNKERIGKAFQGCKDKMRLTDGVREIVQELFDRYGGRNIETEIKELKQGIARLGEMIKNEKGAKDKSVRAVFAMSMGVAVGLCFLLS